MGEWAIAAAIVYLAWKVVELNYVLERIRLSMEMLDIRIDKTRIGLEDKLGKLVGQNKSMAGRIARMLYHIQKNDREENPSTVPLDSEFEPPTNTLSDAEFGTSYSCNDWIKRNTDKL